MNAKTKQSDFVPRPLSFRWWAVLGLGLAAGLSPAGQGCRARPPAAAAAAAAPVLIQFERTACMGPCPVDVLTVYASGRMLYEGKANAPRQGAYAGQLSRREQQELVRAFEAARFFDFAPTYVSQASDLPTYYLTYARAGRRLKITDYDGAPPSLKALEARLEQLVTAKRWQPQPQKP